MSTIYFHYKICIYAGNVRERVEINRIKSRDACGWKMELSKNYVNYIVVRNVICILSENANVALQVKNIFKSYFKLKE